MRTRHIWARPGQHVRVHRPHYGGGGGGNESSAWDMIKILINIGLVVAMIAGAIYILAKFWPLIAFLFFASLFSRVFLKK